MIFGVLTRGADCTNVHLARLMVGVQKAGLDVDDVSLASGSADALGFEVSPEKFILQWNMQTECTFSLSRSLPVVAFVVGQWSSSMVTSPSWRSAIVVLSQSLTRGRLFCLQQSLGQLCVWGKELLVESYVFSAVIGVFAGLTSASVRMHRKRALGAFLKDVVRRLVESHCGQGSREDPCQVVCAPFHRAGGQLGVFKFRRGCDVACPKRERVARTSRKCRCNFWIPRNGNWRSSVVPSAKKTTQFSKHVPHCMLFDMQRVVIRRGAS